MATRIHVKCMSERIPGNPADRRMTMANLICQHELGRNFDDSQDYLRSIGQYAVDRIRCQFLIDTGPRGGESPAKTLSYRWDGERFCARKVTPPLLWYLTETYPFNPEPEARQKPLTDEELRAVCGEEEYGRLVLSRIEQKTRWGLELSRDDVAFLRRSEQRGGDAGDVDTR